MPYIEGETLRDKLSRETQLGIEEAVKIATEVAKALEKLPADRFESAAKFADALKNPSFNIASSRATPAAGRPDASWRERVLPLLAALSVLLLVASLWGWLRPLADKTPVGRFEIPVTGTRMGLGGLTVSPDGRAVVYQSFVGGLVLRPRAELAGNGLLGVSNDEGWSPFFSPDGASVGFETGFPGSLKVTSISGGTARVVVRDSTSGYGGVWARDGNIYYSSARGVLMELQPIPVSASALASAIAPPLTQVEVEALFDHNTRRLDRMPVAAGSLVKTLLMELGRRHVYVELDTPAPDARTIGYAVAQGDVSEVSRLARALGFQNVTGRSLEVRQTDPHRGRADGEAAGRVSGTRRLGLGPYHRAAPSARSDRHRVPDGAGLVRRDVRD